ncbi:hypothetical protein [Butyricimonas virosa]|uniref:hypothetical protein n=1 Tax=Butyricimonas virosa TaxID=544645 RepID=UPI0032C0D673
MDINLGKKIAIYLFSFIAISYFLILQQNISVACLFIFCEFTLFYRKCNRENLLLGFVVGVVITIIFYEYNIIKYGNYYYLGAFSDDYLFEIDSKFFYQDYGLNFFHIYDSIGILHNSAGYVYVLALLRGFGDIFDGYNVFLPKVLNVFVLQLIAYYIFMTGVKIYNLPRNRVCFVALIFSIYPVLLNIASEVFRDTFVALFFIYVYYSLNQRERKFINIILAFAICVVLFFFRAFASYILLLLIIFYLCRVKNMRQLIGVAFIGMFCVMSQFGDVLGRILHTVEGYNELNGERLGGIGSQIFSLPLYYGFFPRVTFMVLNPIPNLSNLQAMFAGISCFLQIFCVPFVWSALINKNVDIKLKITFIVLFLGVALSTANFRHVTMYLPFAFLLFMFGCNDLRFNTQSYYVFLFCSFVFYIISLGLIFVR